MEPSINNINSPQDLKQLKEGDLETVAGEIRKIIIDTVSKNGGHLGPPLGVVELTLALHYVFDTPKDKLMWDVGHQAYAHKILTGRRDQFPTLKQYEGISGYPNIDESEHDHFTVGHSSTSISQAYGMAVARDLNGGDEQVVAIVGDGALTAGMAYEAINHAGHDKRDLIVILNDNEMSISRNVGAISQYLNRIITAPVYSKARSEVRSLLKKLPEHIGDTAVHVAGKIEESLKGLLVPGMLFEELGFFYVGPIDGHNLPLLLQTFRAIKKMHGPILVHVVTKKGKGYSPAEQKPDKFHGTSAFNIATGEGLKKGAPSFTHAFSESMIELAEKQENLLGITAAMPSGVGLVEFSQKYPDRFFDVAIAEQHAATFAGALAKAGKIPVAAIYSTFLQRATDQVIHDVCLQRANVIFALDRMGIVGEDGATHNGVFTIPLLRSLPHMSIMLPKDGAELKAMMRLSVEQPQGPVALCYPKDKLKDEMFADFPQTELEYGKAEQLLYGEQVAVLALGSMVSVSLEACQSFKKEEGLNPSLVNLRFAKPIDEQMIERLAKDHQQFLVVEESVLQGGVGDVVLEVLRKKNLNVQVERLAIPNEFVEHGSRAIILEQVGLSADNIQKNLKKMYSAGLLLSK